MDPFSITAGTVGITDVTFRVFQYCKKISEAAGQIEDEIVSLQRELESLRNVTKALKAIPTDSVTSAEKIAQPLPVSKQSIQRLWFDVDAVQTECKATLEDLETLLNIKFGPLIDEINRSSDSKLISRFDGVRKAIRRQSKTEELGQFRLRLANSQGSLQALLTALNMQVVGLSLAMDTLLMHRSAYTCTSAEQLTGSVQRLGYELLTALKSLKDRPSTSPNHCPGSVISVASLLSFNKHFTIPRSVSSTFTGRTAFLKQLGDAVFSIGPSTTQRRFVVYGLGGSGKTEFCCKFAQDHQQLFYGVFWVDAASAATANSTFSRIARTGRVEPNIEAAKSWLSALDQPWLLFIDNADGKGGCDSLAELFPTGRRGVVLILARDPSYQTHGTVGTRWLSMEGMELDEANELLLKEASKKGRDDATLKAATLVSETLGCLPLALVHAGKAILVGRCTLDGFVDFFWTFLDKVRNATFDDDESNMLVYSTYEILLKELEEKRDKRFGGQIAAGDAIQLLKVFSFLSCENIPFEILVKAMQNSKIEQDAHDKSAALGPAESQSIRPLFSWERLLQVVHLLRNYEVLKETLPVIPAVLLRRDDGRLRAALALLTQRALITHRGDSEHYSMHPLVHLWSRYRPEMKLSEQALWCQAAATILANCVLLPPLGNDETNIRLRLQLVPHVVHVLECQKKIASKVQKQRAQRKEKWRNIMWPLVGKHVFDRTDARMYAKFSRVFAEGGMWPEAEVLLRQVKDFLDSMFGLEETHTIDVSLALAGSLMYQTRSKEAAQLQKQALQACIKVYGSDNLKTLTVMDMLGISYVHGGHYKEALNLFNEAIDKLTRVKGGDDEEILRFRCMDHLGRLKWMYLLHEESESLHEKAAAGLEQILTETHSDVLTAKENLAMAKLELKRPDKIQDAYNLLEQVHTERLTQLGKEHPLTLLAVSDFARIKAAKGNTAEAEEDFLSAIPIAKRNLGEKHQGVLMGRAHLANLYVQMRRYEEAEEILIDVVQPDNYRRFARDDGEHPDRIGHLWYLMQCYMVQNKYREALDTSRELYAAIENCGGQGLGKEHLLAKRVLESARTLEMKLNTETLSTVRFEMLAEAHAPTRSVGNVMQRRPAATHG